MRKIALVPLCLIALVACSKHDPILPGVRSAIFAQDNLRYINTNVSELPENAPVRKASDCPYTQNATNIVFHNGTRVFMGFPTPNSVKSDQKPVCSGDGVYVGLTTGELVKISQKTNKMVWVADIYKQNNMMGGASIVDIIAPIVVDSDYVYCAGLGNAFCKVKTSDGTKKWCVEIGSMHEFIVLKNVAYIVGNDNNLYAVRISDGAIYWHAPVAENAAPKYENKQIVVGKQKFDAATGTLL